jgi:hypothetical protein
MMEFFGKPHDYFNRVKTADENPNVAAIAAFQRRTASERINSSISWTSVSAQLAWADFDQLRMLTPVVACRRRDVRDSFAGAAMMRRTPVIFGEENR